MKDEAPVMHLDTFKKGISDFTKVVEKAESADLKLTQDKNSFSAWLLGISTGAFVFVFANSDEDLKTAFAGTVHLMLIFHATQVICSVLLRVVISSYAAVKEQKLILLGVQELYLLKNPTNEDLKEEDLFTLYTKLSEFYFMRPIIKGQIGTVMDRIDATSKAVTFLFIVVVLLFLTNYFLFVYTIW